MKTNKLFLGIVLGLSTLISLCIIFFSLAKMIHIGTDAIMIYYSPAYRYYGLGYYAYLPIFAFTYFPISSISPSFLEILFSVYTTEVVLCIYLLKSLALLLTWNLFALIVYLISFKCKYMTIPAYLLVFFAAFKAINNFVDFAMATSVQSIYTIVEIIINVTRNQANRSLTGDMQYVRYMNITSGLYIGANIVILRTLLISLIVPAVIFISMLLSILFAFLRKKKKPAKVSQKLQLQ